MSKREIPEARHTCARRIEDGLHLTSSPFVMAGENLDFYEPDNTCSFCGSLHPDTFMERAEAGTIKIGPTDKGYKAYVFNEGGEGFKQTYRDCPRDAGCTGPDDCTHWVTRDQSQAKFYFQHLSAEQRTRFVALLNDKKLKVGEPGHFYVLPFFIKYKEPDEG